MSELTAQGDYGPLSVEDCALWLDRKYSRHGEIEDKACAELLRALKAENGRLMAALLAVRAAEVNGPSLVRDIAWVLNHGQNLSSVLWQRVDAYINATACLCHGRFPCPEASDREEE